MLTIYIYWVIHYFVEEVFHLRFKAKFHEGKNDFRKMAAASLCYFTLGLAGLLVKSVDLSHLCCIMWQWWSFKYREKAFFKFFLQSPHACNSRSIKDILMTFWVLNIPFGIFIFKALYGSVPEIL